MEAFVLTVAAFTILGAGFLGGIWFIQGVDGLKSPRSMRRKRGEVNDRNGNKARR